MRISELPTPRLRARAMEIAKLYNDEYEDFEIHEAFVWSDTEEKHAFWSFCEDGNWNKAKELQPDLFKPMDGKPHIVLSGICNEKCPILGPELLGYTLVGYTLDCVTDNQDVINYVLSVQNSVYYTTIQEAVDALYSYRREV